MIKTYQELALTIGIKTDTIRKAVCYHIDGFDKDKSSFELVRQSIEDKCCVEKLSYQLKDLLGYV